MKSITALFRKETLIRHCKLLEDALFSMLKANSVKRVIAEMTLVRMCDAALDTSPEAMLSRIAQLEERLDTGAVSIAPQKQEKTEKTTPVVQKTAETPRKAEEKIAPVAEKKPTPTPISASVPTRTLRTIRSWMEVVERISRSDPMRASFVKSSRAYETEDGKVIVRFGDSFSMQMMEQGEARDRLRTAVSAILKRDVGDRELIFEIAEKRADASVIDEIIDATEN
ncbi:MAG: hypothetical protein IJV73_04450, partial [Clostridia bacterium]|nr:hypothetical protein [Clostridia bacterium]